MTRKEIVMSGSIPHSYPTRRLPKQPSLEQLRKQAKDLFEQYRAGDPSRCRGSPAVRAPTRSSNVRTQRRPARAGARLWLRELAQTQSVRRRSKRRQACRRRSRPATRRRCASCSMPGLNWSNMDMAENDEHRALHYAVLRRDSAMVKLLMEAGADARKGIFPHRDATSALAIARDREYGDIVAVIEEEERLRRAEMSCPNATISPVQDQINHAIRRATTPTAIRLLQTDGSLIQACDRDGGRRCTSPRKKRTRRWWRGCLSRRAKARKRGRPRLDSARPRCACRRSAKRTREAVSCHRQAAATSMARR